MLVKIKILLKVEEIFILEMVFKSSLYLILDYFSGKLILMKRALVFLLVVLGIPVQAQFRNILLDEGSPTNRACEPSIAVSLKDPKIIVAGSVLNNVYYTSDGGATWKTSKLKSSMGVWGDPVVISDFKGKFYYFHLSDPTGKNWASEEILDRIVVQESDDNGETWSDGAAIGLNHPKDQDKEWAIADRKGKLYVTWTQFDKYGSKDPACQSNILLSSSTNGKKWSPPIVISQTPGDCIDDDNTTEGAVPAVTADGKSVFVAWANAGKIYFDRSLDGGGTWLKNDIIVTEQPGGWSMNIPGLDRCNGMPVLVCDVTKKTQQSGILYLVWADQRNGENDTDIWMMRSINYGDNWTSPMRINNDGPGKHQFLPWVTTDPTTGYIYIVYYDRRDHADNSTDVYLAYSTDAGTTFKNVKISETPFIPTTETFFGDYTNISANKGVIAAIWTRMDSGKTSVMTAIIKHEELEKQK
jgi:hypothetical protein